MAKGIVRLGWMLGVAVVLALLAFAASRPPLSNALVSWVAASRGVKPARVSGAYFGFTNMRIGAGSLGPGPDLKVSGLRLTYRPLALLRGHVESITAKSISVVASYRNGALKLPLGGTGGGGTAKPATGSLFLPRVDVKSLLVRINGLSAPVTASGMLTLAPTSTGAHHLTFDGQVGAPQPLDGRLDADLAPDGDITINANFTKAPDVAAARTAPSVDIADIQAAAHLSRSGLQSANGTVDITSGSLKGARFGAGRANFALSRSAGGTLAMSLGDIRLTGAAAAELRDLLQTRLAAVTAKPPLSAYGGEIKALLALIGGTGSLSADLAIAPPASTDTAWHVLVNSAQAKLVPKAAGKPLVIDVTPSDSGPAEINVATKEALRVTGDVGLNVSTPGPSFKSAGARFSFVGGENHVGLQRLVLTGLAADWPSKALTLGLDASTLGYEPTGSARLTLSGANLDADGLLADGVRARDLKLGLSGALDAERGALAFTPDTGCTVLTFAGLTARGQTLSNGAVQACAQGGGPLVSYDPSRASPIHTAAVVKGGSVALDMRTGSVRLASLVGDVNADIGGATPSVQLSNVQAQLVDGNTAPRFAPIDITSTAGLESGKLSGTLSASSLGKRLLSAKLAGNMAAKTATLDFDTGAISFTKTSTPIQKLLPVLRGMVTGATGSVRAQGAFAWRANKLTSNGKVTLKGFGAGTTLGRVEGIDGTIMLDRLTPPRTPKPQTITVKTADVGLPLTDGEVTLNLPDKFELQIVNAHWPWAGGTLGVAKGAFVPGAKTQHLEMTASGIDLTQVFKLLSIDGLSGNGIVDGSLPVEVRGGDAYIVNGVLKARGQGVLRYTGEAAAAAASKGEAPKLLFTALENFHYQSLEIGVDGRMTGKITLTMKLHGYNPALYDGHAFAINIKVESALAELIRQSTVGLRIPEEIKRSLPGAQ